MAVIFPCFALHPSASKQNVSLNTSSMFCYAAIALVTTILLSGLTHVQADADLRLISWGQLQKKTGYFTKSGVWRGGLPKKERNEDDVWNRCLEKHENGSFCQTWVEEGQSSQAFRNGTCNCTEATELYCSKWNCISEETERYCSEESRWVRKGAKTCSPKEIEYTEECKCLKEEEAGRYCEEWRCSENNHNGTIREGKYFCVNASTPITATLETATPETTIPETATQYCLRWYGELSSNRDVESISCECVAKDKGHCERWECKARTLLRCSKHKGGWCHLEVSIGVFGVIGLFFLVGGMVIIFSGFCARAISTETRKQIFTIYSLFLVLPWMAGVAIAGGIEGIGWVILMWAIPFIVLATIFICRSTKWQDFRARRRRRLQNNRPNNDANQPASTEQQAASGSDQQTPFLPNTAPDDRNGGDGPSTPKQTSTEVKIRDPKTGKYVQS